MYRHIEPQKSMKRQWFYNIRQRFAVLIAFKNNGQKRPKCHLGLYYEPFLIDLLICLDYCWIWILMTLMPIFRAVRNRLCKQSEWTQSDFTPFLCRSSPVGTKKNRRAPNASLNNPTKLTICCGVGGMGEAFLDFAVQHASSNLLSKKACLHKFDFQKSQSKK